MPADAHAPTAASPSTGRGDIGLPGLFSLGLPALQRRGVWAVAATSTYGFSEGDAPQSGGHHRAAGALAIALTPLAGLDLSLRLAGRRETHPADAGGADRSYSGEPSLVGRYGKAVGGALWGGELAVRVPGEEAPSLNFAASVIDLKLLAGYLSGSLTVAGFGGFRYDRSAHAKPDLRRTRRGDRLALGLSEYNAALVGVGASYRLRSATELIVEASAEILLGVPSLSQSPMRTAVGIRHQFGDHWQVFALALASPSERPRSDPNAPLLPNEPRLGFGLGASYAWGSELRRAATSAGADDDAAHGAAAEPPPMPSGTAPEAPAAETATLAPVEPAGQLRGLIRSFKGRGLAAVVRVEPLGSQTRAEEDGSFTLDVPPGSYEVEIEAEGYATQRRHVRVEENGVTILNADLRLSRGAP